MDSNKITAAYKANAKRMVCKFIDSLAEGDEMHTEAECEILSKPNYITGYKEFIAGDRALVIKMYQHRDKTAKEFDGFTVVQPISIVGNEKGKGKEDRYDEL